MSRPETAVVARTPASAGAFPPPGSGWIGNNEALQAEEIVRFFGDGTTQAMWNAAFAAFGDRFLAGVVAIEVCVAH